MLFSFKEIYWGRDSEDFRSIQEDFWLSVWYRQGGKKPSLPLLYQWNSPSYKDSINSPCICPCVYCRGSRRSVALIWGRRSKKVLRGQQRPPCTLPNPSPKKEKSLAKPAHSGQFHRSGQNTAVLVWSSGSSVVVWLCIISVERGDHEEGDRHGRRWSLQSPPSAEETKRFLLQRSRQQLQGVRGQWVSNLKSVFSSSVKLYPLFVAVASLSITDITVMMAVLQRGNGSRPPQGFKVVPAVAGLQGQQCRI